MQRAPLEFDPMSVAVGEEDAVARHLEGPNVILVRVDGRCFVEKSRLLSEWSRALHFPEYFGGNWDAFDECLGDLSWLDADRVVVLVTNARAIPEGPVLETWWSIVAAVCDERRRTGGIFLEIVFLVESRDVTIPSRIAQLQWVILDGLP